MANDTSPAKRSSSFGTLTLSFSMQMDYFRLVNIAPAIVNANLQEKNVLIQYKYIFLTISISRQDHGGKYYNRSLR